MAGTAQDHSENRKIQALVSNISPDLLDLSRKVWGFAEVGLREDKSSKAQAEYLRAEGFKVTTGTGGMPTAFVAEWGSGDPVLGLLGEYDALAGLSQKASPVREPVVPGAPGHGCGHNLLGTGALGAAVALKRYMEENGLKATIRYYGCPAEETLVGKVFMAREGVFNDLSAAITWHPAATNTVEMGSANGMNSAKFTFLGKTAHAAGDPHNGRSALDAVELMDMAANYLREHVIPDARIHYVITEGGGQPNVVPARAQVWYYVRAPHRHQVDEIYGRLMDCAKGAALMTGTTFEVEFLAGCYDVLPNETLGELSLEILKELGAPSFTEEDLEFAAELAKSLDRKEVEAGLKAANAPQELFSQVMNTTVIDPLDRGKVGAGSTDVGDVSWIVPTVQINTACWPIGAPGHSWQVAASSGHGIGEKGMLRAAEVMALTGLRLIEHPDLIKKAHDEFSHRLEGQKYESPLPKGLKPPLGQFK